MITREEALNYLNQTIENKNILKHMIAAEAMMGALARELGTRNEELGISEDESSSAEAAADKWKMAGLLHDGDYLPSVPVEKQGVEVTRILREKGYEIPENVAQAMAAHNWNNNGVEPKSEMDWALFCGDSLTGLIVAATLILPTKKLADLTVESVLKRYKESSFAKGTRRAEIAMCQEKLGIPLDEFVKITLEAMKGISNEIGL